MDSMTGLSKGRRFRFPVPTARFPIKDRPERIFCQNEVMKIKVYGWSFFLISLAFMIAHANIAVAASISSSATQSTTAAAASSTPGNSIAHKKGTSSGVFFDLPVTYNRKVSQWISYYQTNGRKWFREWLERSTIYMPGIQKELQRAGMPQDLAYMAMIESGFSTSATSHADAVGPWQFIAATGNRYGLRSQWWIDERRDMKKSTIAAIRYMRDLYQEFGSWYLVAASYNMGENGLRRQIQKYRTNDFWQLAALGALPAETKDYVPKIIAAMMVSKSPSLYGFRGYTKYDPLEYEVVSVPGGTNLSTLADHLRVTRKSLKDLNSELILGYVPNQVDRHYIKIPRGASTMVSQYVEQMKNPRRVASGDY